MEPHHEPGKRPERPADHPAVLPGPDEVSLAAPGRPHPNAPPLALEMAVSLR